MNAELEAVIKASQARMRQFEEKLSHEIDIFDQEVDQRHSFNGQRFSSISEELRPISWPLWGVILETPSGHKVYKEHVPMEMMNKYPRTFASSPANFQNNPDEPVGIGYYKPSPTAQAIIEGRKWGINKYAHDEEYVSNPPYGIIMKKPSPRPECVDDFDHDRPKGKLAREQPNTKLVSSYWRRKWKIPEDW